MVAVAHVVEDFSPANGGVTTAVCGLAAMLRRFDVVNEVFTAGDGAFAVAYGLHTSAARFAALGPIWRWAPSLRQGLLRAIGTGAIPHIHGLWMYPQWMAARECNVRAHPFVVSPHNMLGGWLWRRGMIRRIKKTAYWKCVAYPAFRNATVVHALTEFERDTLKAGFFESQRIEVLPNPIDVHEVDRRAPDQKVNTHRPYFLFLGRLHPVKGLELLIDAYGRLQDAPELWIAGSAADLAYEAMLHKRVARSARPGAIRFLGAVADEEKWGLVKAAWCLCAPSYSEGSSMSALESLACSTPVVTTRAAGLTDAERGGGIIAEQTVDAVENALRRACDWSIEERNLRGSQARGVALDTYSPAVIGPKYVAMYKSLTN